VKGRGNGEGTLFNSRKRCLTGRHREGSPKGKRRGGYIPGKGGGEVPEKKKIEHQFIPSPGGEEGTERKKGKTVRGQVEEGGKEM